MIQGSAMHALSGRLLLYAAEDGKYLLAVRFLSNIDILTDCRILFDGSNNADIINNRMELVIRHIQSQRQEIFNIAVT